VINKVQNYCDVHTAAIMDIPILQESSLSSCRSSDYKEANKQ
jgi:hypothetical protein